MPKGRLEAFSDGVIAIIITIMVLELKVPEGHDFAALMHLAPRLCGYVLSFVYIGIYWSNHHHLLHTADRLTSLDSQSLNRGLNWAIELQWLPEPLKQLLQQALNRQNS